MQRIQLVRHFEQNIAVMLLSSRLGQRGPGGVARGQLDFLQAARLVFEPARDVREETCFAERLIENCFEAAAERGTVDGVGLLFADAADGALLDELALESEERRQGIVPRLERLHFFANSKQLAEKIL